MFDKLIELLLSVWRSLVPFRVVDQYQRGVLLRLGKYRRTVAPGLVWVWPLLDELLTATTVTTTEQTTPQSVTTEAGATIVFSLALTYRVTDVKAYLLEIHDHTGVVLDCVAGAAYDVIRTAKGVDKQKALLRRILTRANGKASAYGVTFDDIQFSDFAKAPTFRLIQGAV